jgi:hypothetical protein
MGAPANTINPLTQSVGFSLRTVQITQVDQTQGIALAVDQQRVQVQIPIYLARAKGRIPAEGEIWLIDQSLGFWSLAAYVGKSANDFQVISGTAGGRRIELDPNGLRYYNAAGNLWMDINTTTDTVTIKADTWHPLTLQNGWVGTGSAVDPVPSYQRLATGGVHITGIVKNGTSADGTTIATLPTGYRPLTNRTVPIYVGKTPAAGTGSPAFLIQADGTIQVYGASAGGTTATVIFNFVLPLDL